jgi:hypothetical protein
MVSTTNAKAVIWEGFMPEFDEASKTAQKARDAMERGQRAAEQVAGESLRGAEQSYSAAFENIRDLNVKLIEIARANADAVCDLARDIATAKAPSEVLGVWMDHAQKQFKVASQHANDLAGLGQKLATESTAPMTRSVQRAFAQTT